MSDRAAPLFIGVGTPDRRDDGVGPVVAAALAAQGRAAVVAARDGAALATLLDGPEAVVLLDATRGAGPAGTLTVMDLGRRRPPAALSPPSGHLLGLAEGVGIARALGAAPARLVFFGIEGRDFGWGRGLSPPVATAARMLARRLARY